MRQFALLLLVVTGLFAASSGPRARPEAQSASADTSIYRATSDHLRSTIEQGERVVYLDGGVRIDHGTTTITSVRGKHYPNRRYIVLYDSVRVVDGTATILSDVGEYFGLTNTVELDGHVRFSDRGWNARCDRVKYNRATRTAILTGHLSAADSTRTMRADTVVYDRDREIADATGKVTIVDTVQDYSLAGDHARFDRVKKKAVVDKRPVLTFDLKTQEKGLVTSRTMQFDVDARVGVAEGDVNMAKGATRAHCDSATIYDREGRAELFGEPRATNGPSTMTGKRMVLWYGKKEVNRVLLPESGRLSQAPGAGSPWREDSWLEGDSISIHLSNEQVDSVTIPKNAKAMYYPVESETNKVSNNYSTGDRMFFAFKNKVIDYIRISGASTGLYKYMNLAPRETIDSLAAKADSTLKYRNFVRAHERVQYNADRIEYYAQNEDVRLRGHAFLKYQNSSLEAKRIDYNSRLNLIEATGDPVLEEDQQRIYGNEMGYDLDTKGGVIATGSTKYGEGYYQGQDIFKVGTDILKVYNSTYTTCDLAQPHYSFHAKKMKVYVNDKIVSGPILLYIGKLPVFWLPFIVNTLHHARSSGFLKPNLDIGIGSREGRFVQGLGYYWATNDYTDFLLSGDFNERRSIRLHLVNRYVERYVLDGGVRLDYVYANNSATNVWTNEWMFESTHSQTFSPSASFNSSLKFVSSDNAQQSINAAQDITRFVDRKIYSSGSYRKSWGGTSLSLSGSRDQKLNVTVPTEPRVSTTFPSFSLNFPTRSLWFGDTHPALTRGLWERALGSVLFTPKISATRTSEESIARKYSALSSGYNMGFNRQLHLGFIGINPTAGLGWSYFKVLKYQVNDKYDSLYPPSSRPRDKNEITMNLGSGMSAKVYGTVYPRIGALVGIRHTITPSLQYQFTPKLTESQRRTQSVQWSVDNTIDLKLKKGDKEVKANDVIAWYVTGSYNPELPASSAFSNISSRSELKVGNLMTFNMNNLYSPYQGKILSSDFSVDVNFTLRGALAYPATWSTPERERIAAAVDEEKTKHAKPHESPVPESPVAPAGWSFTVGYDYSESRAGLSRTMRSNVKYNGSAQISKGWRLHVTGYYDVNARSFTQQYYSLDRDLHCWQASFTHTRTGKDWAYYFQISIKAHPDIKYERGSRGAQSDLGSYLGGGSVGGGY